MGNASDEDLANFIAVAAAPIQHIDPSKLLPPLELPPKDSEALDQFKQRRNLPLEDKYQDFEPEDMRIPKRKSKIVNIHRIKEVQEKIISKKKQMFTDVLWETSKIMFE